MARLLPAILMLLCALPSSASAHAVVSSESGRISWQSADPDSPSSLAVTVVGERIRFADPGEHGGMSTGNGCDPGEVDAQGFIREVTCPKAGVTELFVDLDGGDDTATIDVPLTVTASGRTGNDRITSAGADDTLFGGEGDDVLEPGAGSDVVQGEAGDDQLKVRDGVADQAVCGDGNDVAETDERDAIAADAGCETVNGATTPGEPTPPPGGGPPPAADQVPPRIEPPSGRTTLRVRRGRVVLRVGVDEPARISVSGTLRARGKRFVLRGASSATAPGVRSVAIRISARARRALGRGRATAVRLSIVGRDAAGNAARRTVTVRLRA